MYFWSSERAGAMENVTNKRGVEVEKPVAVNHYNKNMGAVDRKDQVCLPTPPPPS